MNAACARPRRPRRLLDRVAFSERPALRIVRCRELRARLSQPGRACARADGDLCARRADAEVLARAPRYAARGTVRGQARRLRRVLGRGGVGARGRELRRRVSARRASDGAAHRGGRRKSRRQRVHAFARIHGSRWRPRHVPAERRFDAMAIWNTFDQLAEPRTRAQSRAHAAAPDGVLALRVPNGEVYAALRRRLTTGNAMVRRAARAIMAQNNLLGFPYRAGFSPASLAPAAGRNRVRGGRRPGRRARADADEWTQAMGAPRGNGWSSGLVGCRCPALAPLGALVRGLRSAEGVQTFSHLPCV